MKRIVICCDGTWNSLIGAAVPAGQTNVARLYLSVCPRDDAGIVQEARYVEGVGTGRLQRIRGGAFGFGLSERVKRAYAEIVDLYEPGDELWLFGFSRGAFTARSAAGLLRTVGILRPEHAGRLDEAYDIYREPSEDGADSARARVFREAYSIRPQGIRFVGVFDTVGALGVPVSRWNPLRLLNRRWEFHDTTLSSTVADARHALAIDERRGPFRPTLWDDSPRSGGGQRVEQAWFAGVHSDVGGGYERDGLSQLTLRWMAAEASAQGLALAPLLIPGSGRPGPPFPEWMVGRAREKGLGGGEPLDVLSGLVRPADPGQEPNESLKGGYRLLFRHRRRLPYPRRAGGAYPFQWVASSARHLTRERPGYRRASRGLMAYLKADGEVREVPGGEG
ncbi:MAG: DUF2235 domain-containing protein [Miltoncostaeaceae bacterium]